MAKGHLVLLLHAHLPFVRNPEYERFLEENWLYEAIAETYLPLLRCLNSLDADGMPFKIALSLSPTLCAMLEDELLQNRFVRYTKTLIELCDKELERTKGEPAYHRLARMYKDLHQRNLEDFIQKYEMRILRGFDALGLKGKIEFMTTAATHAYLPLYEHFPEAIEAQVSLAVASHQRFFGRAANGFWLPECGYFPGLEKYLKSHGFRYFYTAVHGLLFASQKPRYGVFSPLACPNGVFAFSRDVSSTNAVWSPEEGYPGDPVYRDFYRDIGFDLPLSYIGPYVHEGGVRIFTGLKYHAITGKTDQKVPYDPEAALRRVHEHADNFIYNRETQVRKLCLVMDREPVISCPFDAELFGHWWFEGPQWLEAVIRRICQSQTLSMLSPSDCIKNTKQGFQTAQPAYSSWGNKGYSEVWLDGSNDWVYRHTHMAIERMYDLINRYPHEQSLKKRALNQAAREVLLSQASDWPFIMHAGTAVQYAQERVKEHIGNFNTIYESLSSGVVSTEWLTRIEKKNTLFPDIDYRILGRR